MSKITPGKWTAEYDAPNDVWAIVMRHEYSDGSAYVKCIAQHVDDSNARAIAAVPEMMEALEALVNAEALSKVEAIVAGWNGPPEKPYSPHPPQLGARIETTCGRVYKLDEAMKAARSALAKAKGETP